MNRRAERPWVSGLAVGVAIAVPLGEYIAGEARYIGESAEAAAAAVGAVVICTALVGRFLAGRALGCASIGLFSAAILASVVYSGPRLCVHLGQALLARVDGPSDPRVPGAITLIETAVRAPFTGDQACEDLTGFELKLGAGDRSHWIRCAERDCGKAEACRTALGPPDREWR